MAIYSEDLMNDATETLCGKRSIQHFWILNHTGDWKSGCLRLCCFDYFLNKKDVYITIYFFSYCNFILKVIQCFLSHKIPTSWSQYGLIKLIKLIYVTACSHLIDINKNTIHCIYCYMLRTAYTVYVSALDQSHPVLAPSCSSLTSDSSSIHHTNTNLLQHTNNLCAIFSGC